MLLEKMEAVILEAISLTGLPITPGGGRGEYDVAWSGRRIEGMPENFFAEVFVGGIDLRTEEGCLSGPSFVLEVRVGGYDLVDHRNEFSGLYWGHTVTDDDLERDSAALVQELKNCVRVAWNDLPRFYRKMLAEKEQQKGVLEQLRREGKLVE